MQISLDRLRPGERGRVVSGPESPRSETLTRLGLIPGTELCCLRRSPLGDPTAYRFRGTVLALRRRDAARLLVTRVETEVEP